ncbi:MAG: hypothetical protein ACR2IH_09970, partial [Pyrinomonadaceae bacterium]
KMGDQNQMARLLPQLQQQQKIDDFNSDEAYKKAQTDTIPLDDANRVAQIASQAQQAKDRRTQTALGSLNRLPSFDPKNPAHAQLAKEAGLDPATMDKWDNRNPLLKSIGDKTYKFDRTTGDFTPTNLPSDEAKTLVPFDVLNPDTKQIEHYNVPEKDAARFRVSQEAQGKSIQAAANRQKSQQAFTAGQTTEKARNAIERGNTHIAKLSGDQTAADKFYDQWVKRNGADATPEQAQAMRDQIYKTFKVPVPAVSSQR